MNKKKIMFVSAIVLLLAGISLVTIPQVIGAGGSGGGSSGSNSVIVPPIRYTSMCCIQDVYWVDWSTSEYWFQLPVSVTVWDSNLNPVQYVSVHIKIFDSNGGLRFDQTKKTAGNGIAKFGFHASRMSLVNWADSNNNKVEVWIDDTQGYSTYMEKVFGLKMD